MSGRRSIGLVIASLSLLVLSYFMGYYMLNPIMRTLHEEGLIPGATEEEWRYYGGLVATALQGVGLVLSFAWGVLADKYGRRQVIFLLALIMGAGMILVSTATNYTQLLSFFLLFGVGYVGVGPAIYAFISDAVPPESRGRGYASYYVSSVLAMIVAIITAGVLLPWRFAYTISGALVLVTATILYFSSRGITVGFSEAGREIRTYKFREALPSLKKKTVLLVLLMIVPWTIPWGMLSVWSIDYIQTRWGVTKGTASLVIALATLSIAIGHIVGGSLSDRLVKRGDLGGRTKVSILGVALGYVAMLSMICYPYPHGDANFTALLLPASLAVFGMTFTTFAYPNINTILSEVVVPEHRGTVFAVYSILNNLGWTLGPTFYPWLMGALFKTGDVVVSMTLAASATVSLWLLALLMWVLIHKFYPGDKI
ncbi:MFS transporter [Infirmifilum lucidum]|uniref:MFS transporter n=1 Tax=Infirmifilum lucidum TaxID=2776706 RepID=A0A7L9FH07_9CREN|nr:MFS transporter [Infirmifilum lucidum]QOJ78602.1 MFS transporter [Infirmifilum lucidum]